MEIYIFYFVITDEIIKLLINQEERAVHEVGPTLQRLRVPGQPPVDPPGALRDPGRVPAEGAGRGGRGRVVLRRR